MKTERQRDRELCNISFSLLGARNSGVLADERSEFVGWFIPRHRWKRRFKQRDRETERGF